MVDIGGNYQDPGAVNDPYAGMLPPGVMPFEPATLPTEQGLEALLLSTMSKSELEKMFHDFQASYPTLPHHLPQTPNDNTGDATVKEFVMKAAMLKDQIISEMLDAWNASVQQQAEEGRKRGIADQLLAERKSADRNLQDVINQAEGSSNYQLYLSSLPLNLRAEAVKVSADNIVDHYIKNTRNPLIRENEDAAKVVLPSMLLEALVISPLAGQIVSDSISLQSVGRVTNPTIDQVQSLSTATAVDIVQQQAVPVINLFIMDMVKDVTVELYNKSAGNASEKPKDIDFANAFAMQVLGGIQAEGYIKGELIKNIDGFSTMPPEQQATAMQQVKAFLLAGALALFVHVDGGKLQEVELKEMLLEKKGLGADRRFDLVNALNDVIATVPEAARQGFVESLLKYVASMPDPGKLTSFMHALNAASEEISQSTRFAKGESSS
jgi:hypothetical protein